MIFQSQIIRNIRKHQPQPTHAMVTWQPAASSPTSPKSAASQCMSPYADSRQPVSSRQSPHHAKRRQRGHGGTETHRLCHREIFNRSSGGQATCICANGVDIKRAVCRIKGASSDRTLFSVQLVVDTELWTAATGRPAMLTTGAEMPISPNMASSTATE